MASSKRIVVPGSERKLLPNARVVGAVDPGQRIEITVVVRPRTSGADSGAEEGQAIAAGALLPERRQYLSREDFASQRGADPEDLAKVEAFAQQHHLTVVEASIPKRTVRLAGTVSSLTSAFRPNLKKTKLGGQTY